MENKYYTPEIEEFRVGFEYESFERIHRGDRGDDYEDKWVKRTVKDANQPYMNGSPKSAYHVSITNQGAKIEDWNKKNEVPLKQGYIVSQLSWSYRNKVILPPNYGKDFYKGIGIIPIPEEVRYKNPVNYVVKKTLQANTPKKKSKSKSSSYKK